MQYRQGDVLISEIDSIPKEFKKVEHQGIFTVALGEVTGHHHDYVGRKLTIADKPNFNIYQDDKGNTIMEVLEGKVDLTHQEHQTITFTPGIYVTTIQEEYDPLLEFKRVQD